MTARRKRDSLVWGIVLIALGTIFLLDRLGLDAWDAVWRFWPAILIIWGASKLFDGLKERRRNQAANNGTANRPE
jgi:LiaF transmembrane domain